MYYLVKICVHFRPKKSVDTEIYLALPPDTAKTGKVQDSRPTLIRLDSKSPNRFKGKFPTPIERFIQRIQNYFSVYNPPEYLNDLQRPGINNPENEEYQVNHSNDTQIILPCNGTSTIVIIPMPLENENLSSDQNTDPDKFTEVYNVPTTPKSDNFEITTTKPKCPEDITPKPMSYTKDIIMTTKLNCLEMTTPKSNCPETTTSKPNCSEIITSNPNSPEVTTPKIKCPELSTPITNYLEVTTPKSNSPKVIISKPKCPEVSTPIPNCPEVTTPKSNCSEVINQKPKCPELSTPKPDCSEITTLKPKYPEVSILEPECLEATSKKSPCPPKQLILPNDHRPIISGNRPNEVPPLNLVTQPVLSSTVVYFYKNPSTLSYPNAPAYYMPNTPSPYEEHTRKPKSPILRLKKLLFPHLYAIFHPED